MLHQSQLALIGHEIRGRSLEAANLGSLKLAEDGFVDTRHAQNLCAHVWDGGTKLGMRWYAVITVELSYESCRRKNSKGRMRTT